MEFSFSFKLLSFQYITCYSLSRRAGSALSGGKGFQYITCYSLSVLWSDSSKGKSVSIHHMLLFIKSLFPWLTAFCFVSIHHMLLFITWGDKGNTEGKCFNTSHVTLYRLTILNMVNMYGCFNTSHVTLYL